MIYSNKQRSLLELWRKNELARINILTGSVRSGKTYISVVLWTFFVCSMPDDATFLMTAKTLTTLKRNVLELLLKLVGENNFSFSISKKEGLLFGRRIYFEGASDIRSESKIRGLTLHGAYIDEATLMEESFFTMILSRLSAKDAKLFATTNPDSPHHWLMKKYISRASELDMMVMKFLIDDNVFLSKSYIENLKKEYSGVFYDRFILGLWVLAEGLVYPMFDEKKHIVNCENISGEYYVSIDYGTANPCSMGLWCIMNGNASNGGIAYRVKEYYHSGRDSKAMLTDEEYYAQLERLCGDRIIQHVIVDPSAASFIETIKRHGKYTVKKAKNDVLNGIRCVAGYLSAGKLVFDASCENTIREFSLYSWDENAQEDKVVKTYDHAMDDIRYFCYTVLRRCI